jgi:hypothetical protein
MLEIMRETGVHVVQGDRSHARADNLRRKFGSWVGRAFRRTLLGDVIRDTGCSLRLMKREVALAIPLEYRGMHRFIPITAMHLGFRVVEMPVNHRPRVAGTAKYGMIDRAIPGLFDCMAVRWMAKRRRPTHAQALYLHDDGLVGRAEPGFEPPVVVVEYDAERKRPSQTLAVQPARVAAAPAE